MLLDSSLYFSDYFSNFADYVHDLEQGLISGGDIERFIHLSAKQRIKIGLMR